jgi:membrane dipeptidase
MFIILEESKTMKNFRNLNKEEEERALEVHRKSVVIDCHCDTLVHLSPRPPVSVYLSGYFGLPRELTAADINQTIYYPARKSLASLNEYLSIDIPKMLQGGQTCQAFAIWIEPEFKPDHGVLRTMQMVDTLQNELEANPDAILLAKTTGDILKAKKQGKVAALLSIESGGDAIEGDLSVLRVLHRLGLRVFGLTYNRRNMLADGWAENRTKGGLTELGAQVVGECNRLGIVVDVSHIGDASFYDVMSTSKDPVIASHSGLRSLNNIPRHLNEDQVKTLAEKGGVVGVMYGLGPEKETTLEGIVNQIDEVVKTAGVDYVGLGSDFDGGCKGVGLEDASKLPNLTKELVARGYSDKEIIKILGGNFLRVFSRIWK